MWRAGSLSKRVPYENEADLEAAIGEIASDLFGTARIYLNVKKKVGRNIPDGYLLDLSGREAALYFVEIELSAHDPFRHIAVQVLQFSLSFDDDKWGVKRVLFDAVKGDTRAWAACESYVKNRSLNSVDHLLELLIQKPFAALVIIDDASNVLEAVLTQKLKFPVEVLEIQRFESESGERQYLFEPFLRDVRADLSGGTSAGIASGTLAVSDIDTIVVPAREEGFQQVFLGEDEWRSIRIHGSMIPQIKYIAAYRVAPISAITHIAKVKEIVPATDPAKYRLLFEEPAAEIGPIKLVPGGRVKQLQNSRYTTRERLLEAKTLDDVWAQPELA